MKTSTVTTKYETGNTLEENAMQKAEYIYKRYDMSVFADDTGLEVDALGGEPGVYSARYAGGDGHDSEANMTKLLAKLGENNNRKARFRTVIALIEKNADGKDQPTINQFEGIVNGEIIRERRGQGASAMTLYSSPTATTRRSLNWDMK